MADKSVSLKILGLAELARAFKQIESDLPTELKTAFMGIAQNVAGVAQQRMPHLHGKAAGSIRAKATPRGASIEAGGNSAPYFQWLDFGGSTGRGHQDRVGGSGAIKREWMGRPRGDGRYIYPAISEQRDETRQAADKALADVARSAGFDQSGSL